MPAFNSKGLRGSLLEEMINLTNDKYREKKLALIQKVPTPITPIEIDKMKHHITLAYFEQKSTVDYIGAAQGFPICFDAKECAVDTFTLRNVHEHQVTFMKDFENQGGIAFLLIYYSKRDFYYYMRLSEIEVFWDRARQGGRKSVKMEELSEEFFFKNKGGLYIPYLDMINKDLDIRDRIGNTKIDI